MKTKHFFLALGGLVALLQFFPIDRSVPVTDSDLEFHVVQKPPGEVMSLLKQACYDCHSNNTRWPWYAAIQPLGWWIQDHVEEGRAELNFSAFGRISASERGETLAHCAKLIQKGAMPLSSYVSMHPKARLDSAEIALLVDWLLHPAPAIANGRLVAERLSDGDCDDNDGPVRCCFEGMPAQLTPVMTIATDEEPGERLVITGRILKADGRTPAPNVALYAYHTDVHGKYAKKGDETGIRRWHGRLHGWCRTDAEGRYEIHSIRPAQYPGNEIAAHIHAAAWPPELVEPVYIDDFMFADDPLVKKVPPRYASGILTVQKDENGVWRGRRDVVLP